MSAPIWRGCICLCTSSTHFQQNKYAIFLFAPSWMSTNQWELSPAGERWQACIQGSPHWKHLLGGWVSFLKELPEP